MVKQRTCLPAGRQKNKFNINNYLKVIPLGGAGGVNQNMFVYETAQDIVVVDCGIDFPELRPQF